MKKLAGFSYIYNGLKFDIPFIESVESVIEAVDEFVLTECFSDDSTWEECLKLQAKYPDKITLLRTPWVQHFSEISSLANWTMIHVREDIDYIFQLQSDEVVHEKDLEELKNVVNRMEAENKTAARWKYLHFLGGPSITFPFCYLELVRIVKRGNNWKVIGDGVQFAKFGSQIPPEEVLDTNIEIFHYGKMKSPEKGFQKEVSFQELFTDLGFPDPKMKEMQTTLNKDYCDYLYLFKTHIVNKTIKKYEGTHPKAMEEYIKNFKNYGYEQLCSAVEKELRVEEN